MPQVRSRHPRQVHSIVGGLSRVAIPYTLKHQMGSTFNRSRCIVPGQITGGPFCDRGTSPIDLALRDASFTSFSLHAITANCLFSISRSRSILPLFTCVLVSRSRSKIRDQKYVIQTYSIQLLEQYYNSPVLRDSLQGMWITVSQSALDIRRYDISYVYVEMTSKYHVICSL